MNSKQKMYVIYAKGKGYFTNPRYDSRDYLKNDWTNNVSQAKLLLDELSARASVADISGVFDNNIEIQEVFIDKFVKLNVEIYHALRNVPRKLEELFTLAPKISQFFEELRLKATGIVDTIDSGKTVEASELEAIVVAIKKINVVIAYKVEVGEVDETDIDSLVADKELLEAVGRVYQEAVEICNQTIKIA